MPIACRVPDELRGGPFRGSSARDSGLITKGELTSSAWVRLLRDVYVHRDVQITPSVRVAAVLLVSDGAVLAGRTAAWLHGLWSPPPGRSVPLEVARMRGASGDGMAATARTRRVWQGLHARADLVAVDGIVATSPMRTCFDLIRGPQLVEAVVIVDAFAYAEAFTLPEFWDYVDQHRRWPGVRAARLATSLASARSRSPGETRVRMVVVLGGFPEPLVNPPFEASTGEVWYPDLLLFWVPRPTGLEYDGAYHEDVAQRRLDLRRENSILVQGGLPLLRYDAISVQRERERMLQEISRTSGFAPRCDLDPRDFARGPRDLRW